MSITMRVLRDQITSLIQTIENDPDPASRFRAATIARDEIDTAMRRVRRSAAYDGVKAQGAADFADNVGIDRSVLSRLISDHIDATGATEFRLRRVPVSDLLRHQAAPTRTES